MSRLYLAERVRAGRAAFYLSNFGIRKGIQWYEAIIIHRRVYRYPRPRRETLWRRPLLGAERVVLPQSVPEDSLPPESGQVAIVPLLLYLQCES